MRFAGIELPEPVSVGPGATPAGQVTVEEVATGRRLVYDCLICCHCGMHFRLVKGRQAACGRCNARTCGRPACDLHRPAVHPAAEWLRVYRGNRR